MKLILNKYSLVIIFTIISLATTLPLFFPNYPSRVPFFLFPNLFDFIYNLFFLPLFYLSLPLTYFISSFTPCEGLSCIVIPMFSTSIIMITPTILATVFFLIRSKLQSKTWINNFTKFIIIWTFIISTYLVLIFTFFN